MEPTLKIKYRNHRGEEAEREITPVTVFYGNTKWHSTNQWFLTAYDHGKSDMRDFAMSDILEFLQ